MSSDVVRPMNLKQMAASIAGDGGAIVITKGKDGIRIGVHNLDPNDLKDVLCLAIYHAVAKTLPDE